jgi:hypothetical protein
MTVGVMKQAVMVYPIDKDGKKTSHFYSARQFSKMD